MSLALRDDDAALIMWLIERTGIGSFRPIAAQANSKPQFAWLVRTQADCRALVGMLDRFERRDYVPAATGVN